MYCRNGRPNLGIPPNASLDYVVSVHDNFTDYEDQVIQRMIVNESLNIDDFTKREDGIYYQNMEQGTGDAITADSTVTVDYTLTDQRAHYFDPGTTTSTN